MKLSDLSDLPPVRPWTGTTKIPWDEPGFSRRMLREHLSQEHDRASRRFAVVDQHVAWLHDRVLASAPSRVLDLGCGPGLYTARLARLGHTCTGIDFSPASIAHARAEAEREALACDYRQEDLRGANFGHGFDLVLLLFGELNTFAPADARGIIANAGAALAPGGALVLEAHPEDSVRSLGAQAPSWFHARQSLFSDAPHLCLKESAWHAAQRAATECFFVVPLAEETGSEEVIPYVSTTQAWSESEYDALLRDAGLDAPERHPSLTGGPPAPSEESQGLSVRVGRKPTGR